ncbi:conserved protein of unknown function (plasmid) [Rhodovastum atsumiense]|uniref:Uncharacterized protein n=1 Tax=Rhodovastum atsumiense TaxID=504468 RepID=A0A5M6IMZ3_9PROT|nr:hypothetical protein [Rhodovastum atsumiense]KAA5609624.1 hypothetical protein F1189_22950 [Rhodovastum atsumiense]CAH2606485.1 conserved protein of unknown function [Rhodovastum atsumiense]
MTTPQTNKRFPQMPDFWAGITDDSTQTERDAANQALDAWLRTDAGREFLAADKLVAETANTRDITWREAMEACGYE